MKIEIEIPDNKIVELRQYFLHIHPIPQDEKTKKDMFTFRQWLKVWLQQQIINAYRGGKKRKKWDEFSVTYELEVQDEKMD